MVQNRGEYLVMPLVDPGSQVQYPGHPGLASLPGNCPRLTVSGAIHHDDRTRIRPGGQADHGIRTDTPGLGKVVLPKWRNRAEIGQGEAWSAVAQPPGYGHGADPEISVPGVRTVNHEGCPGPGKGQYEQGTVQGVPGRARHHGWERAASKRAAAANAVSPRATRKNVAVPGAMPMRDGMVATPREVASYHGAMSG